MDRSKKMKIIGIIPARKGSQGIKNKNLIDLYSKPLIEYTFLSSLESKLDEVYLNTDDENIIDLCQKKYPMIKVPFKRPDELSCGNTEAIEVALHFLDWYQSEYNTLPDVICWLQPTSPLRETKDIDHAIKLMQDSREVSSVISVVDVDGMSPYKMKSMDEDGFLEDLLPLKDKSTNRQRLPSVYIPNGAIFMVKVETLLREKNFFGEKSVPYPMEQENSINIDSLLDLELTKIIMNKKQKEQK